MKVITHQYLARHYRGLYTDSNIMNIIIIMPKQDELYVQSHSKIILQ